MGNDSKHIKFASSLEGHKPVKGEYDGGACLNGRCCSAYKEVSCSYRWQALEQARANKHIYNFNAKIFGRGQNRINCHQYHLGNETTIREIDQVRNEKGIWNKVPVYGVVNECDENSVKRHNAKDKGAHKGKQTKSKDYTILNFTNGKVPYANQVHHVIAFAELCDSIMKYPNLKDVIGVGLLEEGYNINYKNNVIILPVAKLFSRRTGLPSHRGYHDKYSKKIRRDVARVFQGYNNINMNTGEDHEEPDPKKVKDRLMAISGMWYRRILACVPQNKEVKINKDVITINKVG